MTGQDSGTIEAAELLDAGLCSPQCLLAREPGRWCVCRCRGQFHGALSAALVHAPNVVSPSRPWHDSYAPEVLDRLVPVTNTPAGHDKHFYAARAAHVPFVYASKSAANFWHVHFDAETVDYGSRLTDDAAALFETLLGALLRAGRITTGTPGRSLLGASGVETRHEAQVLGVLARELFLGNFSATRQAIDTLHSRGYGPEPRPSSRETHEGNA